ncbi:MAG: phosphoglycerate kinase [Proteobacteria bacterium]|jgi:phosphoglycerate kinase|nr:phosphoglycerate kinase [Pseudomonadota bacterium]
MDLSKIKKLGDLEAGGKRVLVRVDFNVPLKDGVITDDTRIRAALPTIENLIGRGARVVLMSHLGRPKGKPEAKYSLEPVAARVAELLAAGEIALSDSCVGDGARRVVLDLRDGGVAMLENLRFHAGEEKNDDKLAKELAALGDVYVNDAFGTAHRAHASTAGVPSILRDKAAGFLMEKEVSALGRLLGDVDRPYVAVLGGAKVSDKIGIIENLLGRVNALVIGGAMANTFLAATGGALGTSLVETDKLPLARDLLARAEAKGVKILLPTDAVVAAGPDATLTSVVPSNAVPAGTAAFDIGPASRAKFREVIGRAGTILWNGPMGMFEKPQFAEGTTAMAKAIAGSSAFSVVGGGDSVAAVMQSGLEKGFDHISTGGGASLEMLEGKILPGIAALL